MTQTMLKTESGSVGITFAVADVEPATEKLTTVKTKRAAESLIEGPLEACSDYTDDCCAEISLNPLLAATRLCHNQHRPLILSPDMIWLTILQGLSTHIQANWTNLRDCVIESQASFGTIVVSTEDFPFGSPETPWDALVTDATTQACRSIHSDVRELFHMSFSTTTSKERTAMDLALLEGVNKYFSFLDSFAICGVPSVTLLGTTEDWKSIRRAIEQLGRFNLEWWRHHLAPICDEFVNAACGRANKDHWRQIYASSGSSICDVEWVTGWIVKLFPYKRRRGVGFRRNPLMDETVKNPQIRITDFAKGLSEVSMRSQRGSTVRLIGGFLGVSQDQDSLALRPKIGWAIQRQTNFERLLDQISSISRIDCANQIPGSAGARGVHSIKLQKFYARYSEVTVRSQLGEELCRFRRTDEVSFLRRDDQQLFFTVFADLPDGRVLGTWNIACTSRLMRDTDPPYEFPAFFIADVDRLRSEGICDLIANNFEDVLRWILEAEDGTLDQAASFRPIAVVNPTSNFQLIQILRPLGRHD